MSVFAGASCFAAASCLVTVSGGVGLLASSGGAGDFSVASGVATAAERSLSLRARAERVRFARFERTLATCGCASSSSAAVDDDWSVSAWLFGDCFYRWCDNRLGNLLDDRDRRLGYRRNIDGCVRGFLRRLC